MFCWEIGFVDELNEVPSSRQDAALEDRVETGYKRTVEGENKIFVTEYQEDLSCFFFDEIRTDTIDDGNG